MARWTKNVALFEMDFVVIPINDNNNHWYIFVIRHPGHCLLPPVKGSRENVIDLDPDSPLSMDVDLPDCEGNAVAQPSVAPDDALRTQFLCLDSLERSHSQKCRVVEAYLRDEAMAKLSKKIAVSRITSHEVEVGCATHLSHL